MVWRGGKLVFSLIWNRQQFFFNRRDALSFWTWKWRRTELPTYFYESVTISSVSIKEILQNASRRGKSAHKKEKGEDELKCLNCIVSSFLFLSLPQRSQSILRPQKFLPLCPPKTIRAFHLQHIILTDKNVHSQRGEKSFLRKWAIEILIGREARPTIVMLCPNREGDGDWLFPQPLFWGWSSLSR